MFGIEPHTMKTFILLKTIVLIFIYAGWLLSLKQHFVGIQLEVSR